MKRLKVPIQSAADSRPGHHREDHGADGSGRESVQGGTERKSMIENGDTQSRHADNQPRIAHMQHQKKWLGARRDPLPAEESPEIDGRSAEETNPNEGGSRDEHPGEE